MKFSRKFPPQEILLALVLVAVTVVSISRLTTFPRIFYDEGITIEIARNFQLFGISDISTAPGQFTDAPYINASSGFPVTIPLALFFRLFGFGLVQARIYALLWLLACFVAVYIFSKRLWGSTHAISAVLLLATFAPLYDNGRRVLGEIPGFVFLLAGLFVLMTRHKPVVAGIFFGLATVSKPSVYLLVVPALMIAAIYNREVRKSIMPILVGVFPVILLWVWLTLPNPLSIHAWEQLLIYYQNPNITSLSGNFIRNLRMFLSQSTLMYFSSIAILISLALYPKRHYIRTDSFVSFLIPYGALLVLYFLRSPGWLKYLLPLELLILIVLPEYLRLTLDRIRRVRLYPIVIISFVVVQGVHLMFFSNITNASNEAQIIAQYVSQQSGMIGIIKSPQIACLIAPERKLQYQPYNMRYIFGQNPLSAPIAQLPRFLILPFGYERIGVFSELELTNLQRYTLIRSGGWAVYELK